MIMHPTNHNLWSGRNEVVIIYPDWIHRFSLLTQAAAKPPSPSVFAQDSAILSRAPRDASRHLTQAERRGMAKAWENTREKNGKTWENHLYPAVI